mmetsp:Transcript_21230/g.31478  ORF Transcript_21230/g.31478 Transcript_21230/m.31478 type:complete len:417 (-) Transcript_21230:1728-2978(-)
MMHLCSRLGHLIMSALLFFAFSSYVNAFSPLSDNSIVGKELGHFRCLPPPCKGVFINDRLVLKAIQPNEKGEHSQKWILTKIQSLYQKNFFLLGMVIAVTLARVFPMLGMNGGILRPELFIGKFGVTFIFLLSGLSLELAELTEAFANFKLNTAVQLSTFAAWPFLVGLPLTRMFTRFFPTCLPPSLLDGLLILTCLPTTVNMCILLTSTAGGNVASALCNAVISNIAGIFVTPALLLKFFGTEVQLPFFDMVWKLCNKVLLPVAIGQVLRKTKVVEVYKKHSKKFKKTQEIVLLGIVWNAFCNAFAEGIGLQMNHFFVLLALLPSLHLGALALFFIIFDKARFPPKDVVAGMFCASQKTLAFGLPLINTIFEGNPNLAAYCAPIMFIHPLQAFLGSFIIPWVERYISSKETERKN